MSIKERNHIDQMNILEIKIIFFIHTDQKLQNALYFIYSRRFSLHGEYSPHSNQCIKDSLVPCTLDKAHPLYFSLMGLHH